MKFVRSVYLSYILDLQVGNVQDTFASCHVDNDNSPKICFFVSNLRERKSVLHIKESCEQDGK